MPARPVASDKISTFGIDYVCESISNGMSMTQIARAIGVDLGSLNTWLLAEPLRFARANDTRRATARIWDEKAEEVLLAATDPVSVPRARELAQHYRWRASKIAPKEYGDAVKIEHSGQVDVRALSDETVDARVRALLDRAAPLTIDNEP